MTSIARPFPLPASIDRQCIAEWLSHEESRSEHIGPESDRAEQGRAEQGRAEQGRAEQGRAEQDRAGAARVTPQSGERVAPVPKAPLNLRAPALLRKGTPFANRYRIDGVLGIGGMGVVYAATHMELELPVAIKVIHPDLLDSEEARARFRTEALAGASLSSPHTIRIYDAGNLGSASCYVVMEQLRGVTLEELLRTSGPLPVGMAVDYVLQAALGLAEAHEQGLIHRDVKPENLFLVRNPGVPPLVKVMDFGIARWLSSEPGLSRLTNPKQSLGSPCYQSPEQMEKARDVDLRTDVWSLGLVLFELLTGSCPFEGDNIQETCWRVLKGPRPSLLAARPGIDPGLARVVDVCLRLDRSQRWSSMAQLSTALAPHASVVSRPLRPTPAPRLTPVPAPSALAPRAPSSRRASWWPQVGTFVLGALTMGAWQTEEPEWAQWVDRARHTGNQAWSGAHEVWTLTRERAEHLLAPIWPGQP